MTCYYYLDCTIEKGGKYLSKSIYFLLAVERSDNTLKEYLEMQKFCAENDIKLAGGSRYDKPKTDTYFIFKYPSENLKEQITAKIKEVEDEIMAEAI